MKTIFFEFFKLIWQEIKLSFLRALVDNLMPLMRDAASFLAQESAKLAKTAYSGVKTVAIDVKNATIHVYRAGISLVRDFWCSLFEEFFTSGSVMSAV